MKDIKNKKPERPVIGTRVSQELKRKLEEKHPNPGEISKLINKLLELYLQNRILGVRITN